MRKTTIRVVTGLDEFQALADVWGELLNKCDTQNSVFLTHERLYSWWQHFGKDKLLNILVVEKENRVIAILPLMTVVYRKWFFTFRVLETIEAENSNYIGIIPAENLQEVMPLIALYLNDVLRTHLAIKLRLVPEDSKILGVLSHNGNLHSHGLSLNINTITSAPYIELPGSWQAFHSSLSYNLRAVLRKGLRKLEASHELEFGTYTLETLDAGLEEFFAIHERRWQRIGKGDLFYSSSNRAFYGDFLRRFMEKGWLNFSYVAADNKVISSKIGFVFNKKYWGSKVARDLDYSRYPVGHIHLAHLINWATENNLSEYDFLQGDEPYKSQWTRKSRKYFQVTITRQGFFSWLYEKRLNTVLYLSQRGIKV